MIGFTIERKKVFVNGIVQGVGFRPFVFNLAKEHDLNGFVANTSRGVEIEIEGTSDHIDTFLNQLEQESPPLSVITDIRSESVAPNGDSDFVIHPSLGQEAVSTLISPDVAVCDDCLRELFDPDDRRYGYPFINCTNCGPRYTIIENIPYDRPFTSMRSFTMCPDCQREYDDPENRRFHAQPNACPECGPDVSLFDSNRLPVETGDPIQETARLLKEGKIVAVKGLGGFHLVVDAENEASVLELRRRKGREEKPLAVMVRDLETARAICRLTREEERTLTSFQHPIVLAFKASGNGLAPSVAPGNDRYGVMLPYTPLHHLLTSYEFRALVMTSANYTEEPICIDNDEAFERLGRIADFFLIHDRDIYLRSDDSVVIHLSGELRQIRRSRGYVPRPLFVDSQGPPVLAVGGELKNTICLLKEDQAFLSQHIGDMENLEAYRFFQMTVEHLGRIFETEPELIVYDLHPGYLSTQWALKQREVPLFGVQHHHGHLAACMAENRLSGPVIGIIMDGTGYGTDGTIWGGEIVVGDYREFRRYGYFETMPLPGGDSAIKSPWKTAIGYLYQTFGEKIPDLPFLEHHNIDPIIRMVAKRFNSPLTSSCGRLFDAVAAMSGGRQTIRYEAQAAIEFMQQASDSDGVEDLDHEVVEMGDHKEMLIGPIVRSVVNAIRRGESLPVISGRFHRTLTVLFTEIATMASQETGIKEVVLSGGVFQNQLLFENLTTRLKDMGMRVYLHSQVPSNDGGLSLGQAMIGRKQLME